MERVVVNDIFNIDKLEHLDNSIKATLSIDKNSEIFKSHFPGQPVVPGACMLQVVKDVLEKSLEFPLILKKADNLKFISMIVPGSTDTVQLDIAYKIVNEVISLTAKISTGDMVCFKLQGSFIKLN
jgi:3-hydroxyacyl-[acyl-carrier-protein] dehydratase